MPLTVSTPGIYVHIPFCQTRCNYCHFVSMPMEEAAADRYAKAVVREMELYCAAGQPREKVDSIYIGGGTPSLLPAADIEAVLSGCRLLFNVAADCEISMEANPGTLTSEKAGDLIRSGVNRVSLGAQSFDDKELSFIGRSHNAGMIPEAVGLLRENGFGNISLDLMLGLPFQTEQSWRKTLRQAAHLAVAHISVYMLDLNERCSLQSMVESGSVQLPGEELLSDLYLETIDYLDSCGYGQYEISNFSRPGFSCRHNLKYWQRVPVYGFGLASHSFDGYRRYANYSGMDAYLQAVETGGSPVESSAPVPDSQAMEETLFLGLRLNRGIDWNRLESRFPNGRAREYRDSLRALEERDLVEWQDTIVRLTPRGMLLSNEIFEIFVG